MAQAAGRGGGRERSLEVILDGPVLKEGPITASRVRTGKSITVAFRSAKVAFFRGAKGDYATDVHSSVLRGMNGAGKAMT